MTRAILLAFVLVTGSLAFGQTLQPPPYCPGWDSLLGAWDADPDPAAPGATGSSVFSRDLQNKILVRRNHAEYPATKYKQASVHDDLMVIYDDPAAKGRRAVYWDNEGHVIRYRASVSPDGCTLTFVSEPGVPDPQYRLTYIVNEPSSIAGKFEIAPPDAPAAFKTYLQWTMHRRGAKTR